MDTLCILNVFVFCVCFSHSFFFPFLSLILCVSFCLAQQSSLLDCISQSCISACCNLVPWSKKVPCPRVGPSSCHICSLMLLVAFSIYAVLFCSSLVTCFCFLLKKKKNIEKSTAQQKNAIPGLFPLFVLITPSCLQSNILCLLGSLKFLNSFLSINSCLL